MKAKVFACLLIITLFCYGRGAKSQTPVSDKQAMAMLKEFYTAYMTEMAGSNGSKKMLNAIIKKYCTKKLIKNIPKLGEKDDCDPLIKAQDSNMECVKNLSFKRDITKPDTYIVSYFYTDIYSKETIVFTIHTAVVKQVDGFKIDNVW